MDFVVVDIETTGGAPDRSGITEIGGILWSKEKGEMKRYETFLKPDYRIPLSIQGLTGITPDMVEEAPKFEAVANTLHAFLGNAVFVAHNVHFDYGFIKKAFGDVGISYKPTLLCTRRYAKKLYPNLKSYSLGNLCRYFELRNDNPHRAMSDAKAALMLLERLIEDDPDGLVMKHSLKQRGGDHFLPTHIDRKTIDDLPGKPGVYFFYDKAGKPLYIGKAKNLKKRVLSHFTGSNTSLRNQGFKREIRSIGHIASGTIEMAGVIEDVQIKRFWPKYNRAQKEPVFFFRIIPYESRDGVKRLTVQKRKRAEDAIKTFNSMASAKHWLFVNAEKHGLNPAWCGLPGYDNNRIAMVNHNKRIPKIYEEAEKGKEPYVIFLEGDTLENHAFLLVDQALVIGYGFAPNNLKRYSFQILKELMTPIKSARIVEKIRDEIEAKENYVKLDRFDDME